MILRKVMDFLVTIEQGEVGLNYQVGVDPLVVVLTNCSPAEADHLASVVVREGLAACVNVIGGVKSFYIWEGAFTEDSESTLVIKTFETAADDLVRRLRQLHSYSTPEFLMLRPNGVDAQYVNWARAQVTSSPTP